MTSHYRAGVYRSAVICLLLLTVSTVISCDEGSDIAYVNMTDKTLDVYIDGLLVHTLEPGETREALILKFSLPTLFEAKDEEGNTVFSETLTWEGLKAREFRIVFTDTVPESRDQRARQSA